MGYQYRYVYQGCVLNNYLPSIPYLSGYAYRGGQSVWNFVEEWLRKDCKVLEKVKSTRIENGFQQSIGLTKETGLWKMQFLEKDISQKLLNVVIE